MYWRNDDLDAHTAVLEKSSTVEEFGLHENGLIPLTSFESFFFSKGKLTQSICYFLIPILQSTPINF